MVGMPLDPMTRHELTRLHSRLGRVLALINNPVSAIFSFMTEPVRSRPRRRVYVSADGEVTRIEALPSGSAVRPSNRSCGPLADPGGSATGGGAWVGHSEPGEGSR